MCRGWRMKRSALPGCITFSPRGTAYSLQAGQQLLCCSSGLSLFPQADKHAAQIYLKMTAHDKIGTMAPDEILTMSDVDEHKAASSKEREILETLRRKYHAKFLMPCFSPGMGYGPYPLHARPTEGGTPWQWVQQQARHSPYGHGVGHLL